jgi:hypothetical protein
LIFTGRLAQPGIMTLIVALFFFGGVQLFFVGLVGEYVLAIYGQVREKPIVFERERINFTASAAPETEQNVGRPQRHDAPTAPSHAGSARSVDRVATS